MKSNEKVSSKEVGLEIGLVISRFLYKTEHLHYGYWPDDLEIIPENVRKAQDLHSKLIIDSIPDDVETILDILSKQPCKVLFRSRLLAPVSKLTFGL